MSDPEQDLELGSGISLRFTGLYGTEPTEDFPHYGAILRFEGDDPCEGSILFDHPVIREKFPDRAKWQVHSWDPLTIRPSVLRHCKVHGDHHGFITDGVWEEV